MWNGKAERVARNRQAQDGVDIYVSPDRSKPIGIQCKLRNGASRQTLTEKDLQKAVEAAKAHGHSLGELIIATTASNDEPMRKCAEQISIERKAKGLFGVTIWSWDQIVALLDTHRRASDKFSTGSAGLALYASGAPLPDIAEVIRERKQSARPVQHDEYIDTIIRLHTSRFTDPLDLTEYYEQSGDEFDDTEDDSPDPPSQMATSDSMAVSCETILEALSEHDSLVVTGELGAGKTYTARRFRTIFNASEDQFAICLNVALPECSILEQIATHLKWSASDSSMEALGPEWKVALLLDGVDECKAEELQARLAEIRSLRRTCPRAKIILFGRDTSSWWEHFGAWPRAQLQPFRDDQRLIYLRRRMLLSEEAARSLERSINSQPGASTLYFNPYFLSVFAECCEVELEGDPAGSEAHSVPGSRAELLNRYVRSLIRRQLKKSEGATLMRAENRGYTVEGCVDRAMACFGASAFQLCVGQRTMFGTRDIQPREGINRAILSYLLRTLSIFSSTAHQWSFNHSALRDYLCAKHVHANDDTSVLMHEISKRAERDIQRSVLSLIVEIAALNRRAPSRDFVAALLSCDPVATVLAMDCERLALQADLDDFVGRSDRINEDLWSLGIVRFLLEDERATAEVERQIENERAPSVSQSLNETLRDSSVWYAAAASARGREKIKRLWKLLLSLSRPWSTLVEESMKGYARADEEYLASLDAFEKCALGIEPIEESTLIRFNERLHAPESEPALIWQFLIRAKLSERGLRQGNRWYSEKVRPQVLEIVVPILRRLSNRQLHRLIVKKALPRLSAVEWEAAHELKSDMHDESTVAVDKPGDRRRAMARKLLQFALFERAWILPQLFKVLPGHAIRCRIDESVKRALVSVLSPLVAKDAVASQILLPSEVPSEITQSWIPGLSGVEAGELVRNGLITSAQLRSDPDLARKVERWKREAGSEEASRLVGAGALNATDFVPSIRRHWLSSMDWHGRLGALVFRRIALWSDLREDQKADLISNAPSWLLWRAVERGDLRATDVRKLLGMRELHLLETRNQDAFIAPLLLEIGVLRPSQIDFAVHRLVAESSDPYLKQRWIAKHIDQLGTFWRAEREVLEMTTTDRPTERGDIWLALLVTGLPYEGIPLARVYHPDIPGSYLDFRLPVLQLSSRSLQAGTIILATASRSDVSGKIRIRDGRLRPVGRGGVVPAGTRPDSVHTLGHPSERDKVRLNRLLKRPELCAAEQEFEARTYADGGAPGLLLTLRVEARDLLQESVELSHPLLLGRRVIVRLSRILGPTVPSVGDYVFGSARVILESHPSRILRWFLGVLVHKV
jgi:hypothetical protein